MKNILVLSPFCKSQQIKNSHGLDKYFNQLFNVINNNFKDQFNCVILGNQKCICTNNKCFQFKNYFYDKYSESRNLISKSLYSIFLFFYVSKLNKFIKKINPSLVINNYFFHIKSKNTIWVQHSSPEAYKGTLFKSKLFNLFSYFIKKISRTATPWKFANYIVNYTKYDESNFKTNSNFFRKRFFIPLALPKHDINYSLDTKKNIKPFVFINRLAPQKKTSYLVEVARFLDEKFQMSIDVYGWGEEQALVLDKPGINYLGKLDNDKAKEILRNYKIFILTSDYEGFSYSALEAMAQGTFVIARNTYPSLKYLLDNNRGLMIHKDTGPEAFADEMINAYNMNLEQCKKDCIRFVSDNLIYEVFEEKWKYVISFCMSNQ